MRAPWWTQARPDPGADYTRQKQSDRRGFFILVGDRHYDLAAVERPPSYQTLVALIRLHPDGATTDFVDRFDLLSAEECARFIGAAVDDFARRGRALDPEVLREDLEILRLEAGRWRDFLVEQDLRWWWQGREPACA